MLCCYLPRLRNVIFIYLFGGFFFKQNPGHPPVLFQQEVRCHNCVVFVHLWYVCIPDVHEFYICWVVLQNDVFKYSCKLCDLKHHCDDPPIKYIMVLSVYALLYLLFFLFLDWAWYIGINKYPINVSTVLSLDMFWYALVCLKLILKFKSSYHGAAL